MYIIVLCKIIAGSLVLCSLRIIVLCIIIAGLLVLCVIIAGLFVFCKQDVTLDALERRQDRILARLEALRTEVDLLLASQGSAAPPRPSHQGSLGQASVVGPAGPWWERRGEVRRDRLPRATQATEESIAALKVRSSPYVVSLPSDLYPHSELYSHFEFYPHSEL